MAELKAGEILVVTDEEFAEYEVKGVYEVVRDCSLSEDRSIKTEKARFEAFAILVLEGAVKKLQVKELWLGTDYMGLVANSEPL